MQYYHVVAFYRGPNLSVGYDFIMHKLYASIVVVNLWQPKSIQVIVVETTIMNWTNFYYNTIFNIKHGNMILISHYKYYIV